MLRRFSVFSLALLLCLLLFPARALADVGNASVLWSGSINDGTQFGAFIKGGTRYDAAVAALGYDSSRLTDEVKAKLSDPGYGGLFYTFANAFSSVSSPLEIPSWVPVFVTTSSVIADLLNNISGSNYPHWSVAVTHSVYDLALRDFLVVLNGGDLGGGGSDTPADSFPEGDYYHISVVHNGNVSIPSDLAVYYADDLYLSVDAYNRLVSLCPSGYKFWVLLFKYSTGSAPNNYNNFTYGCAMSPNVYLNSSGHLAWDAIRNINNLSRLDVLDEDDRLHQIIYWGDSASVGNSWPVAPKYAGPAGFYLSIDSNTPVVHLPFGPGGEWPDPTPLPTPTAPELPEPAEPVVETPVTPTVPTPVWPDITINIDNDPSPGTTPSGLDYTELLTRINDNLISIDSFVRAINSNLNSLRGDLLAEFNGVFDSLRNIYNYLLTIDSVLETHCTHLRNKMEQSAVFIANYMRTLIKWLADQLDYDDLTNVEAPDNSLLTTINEKLGGGTYEPNPIKDEQGYYEWLDDLWDRFLLGDNWQTSMGNISGSFSELKTRFPFSVPWDIVALFRLFVHDPVTPVFDLPLYFSADGSTSVHVDLSPWDSVASLVRPMIFVIFALKLALLSRDLLGGLGADKGGL